MAKVTKRAVLVGCNYPYTKFRLNGCANDVEAIKVVIHEKFGFKEKNIQVLTDNHNSPVPSSSLPTGANIRAALNAMAKKAKPGDVLFFYFSGHGTAIPVLEAHKHFRQDEAIVPCDLNLITDVDFRRLVNRLPDGASFTMLSDSCHSGGLIEKEKRQILPFKGRVTPETTDDQPKGKVKVKAKFLIFDFITHAIDAAAGFAGDAIDAAAGFAHEGVHKIAQGAHKIFGKDVSLKFHRHYMGGAFELDPLQEDDGILLSGCEADETSYDIVSGGRAFGAFTDAVVYILKKASSNDEITNGMLLSKAAKAVGEKTYDTEQNPCLYCSDKNKDKPFLGGGATLTIAADFSYSGALIAGGKEEVGSNTMIPFPTSYADCIRSMSVSKSDRQETDPSPTGDSGILISGCDANETSFDVIVRGEAYGAFTDAVLKVLGKRRDCPVNTRLVYEAREKLKQDGIGVEQIPCLYCSNASVNAPFMGGFA
ncbi:metacaspase-9-like [Hibiscus syriacus]|uniref:metacaspase-9-like n=1 Tax=Hibiscus syriacus TaxID=106335 RepID=UPI0019229264|nr:metacaspase-9-like [Hibiscus syriacus]